MPQLLAHSKTLFVIDDIIADESFDKRRQSLLELAISGRHHYKERAGLKMIHEENNVLMDDELVVVRDLSRKSKHTCLYIRNEYPRGFCIK